MCPCKCEHCTRGVTHCYSSPCDYIDRISKPQSILDTALIARAEDELPGRVITVPDSRLVLPSDSKSRKEIPMGAVLDYFPAALMEVARLIKAGNDKHNPGQPLHWARGKSMDHEHCIIKHFIDRGLVDPDSPLGQTHTVSMVWRALAYLQLECEANGAPMSRGSRG